MQPLLPIEPAQAPAGPWAGGANVAICLSGLGADDIDAIMVDRPPDHAVVEHAVVYPRWWYGRTGRASCISASAVRRWRRITGLDDVDADWLYSYVYGAVHHTEFRRRYRASWRRCRDRRLPLLDDAGLVARLGGELGRLHLAYDRPPAGAGSALRVEGGPALEIDPGGMRYDAAAGRLRLSDATAVAGIPRARYGVGGRHPLGWWCRYYRRHRDPESGIVSDGRVMLPPETLLDQVGHLAAMAVASDRLIDRISGCRMLPPP